MVGTSIHLQVNYTSGAFTVKVTVETSITIPKWHECYATRVVTRVNLVPYVMKREEVFLYLKITGSGEWIEWVFYKN